MDVVAAFIVYVIPALFIIWFMINIVSAQRERNLVAERTRYALKKYRLAQSRQQELHLMNV